jgi:adenylate cyclase
MRWNPWALRGHFRLGSALIMLAFVICHLAAHSILLLSLDRAGDALHFLMAPWQTMTGTALLACAFLVHYTNALWSIYARRSLRLSQWEWWQLALGLCIPVLLMGHVVNARIADVLIGVQGSYSSVLIVQWLISPLLGAVQVAAVVTVWVHACIGIHFWLRTKIWYPDWQIYFAAFGLLMPTLALAGYVSAGNQILRAANNPDFVRMVLAQSNLTEASFAAIRSMVLIGWFIHGGLLALARNALLDRAATKTTHADARKRADGTDSAGRDGP